MNVIEDEKSLSELDRKKEEYIEKRIKKTLPIISTYHTRKSSRKKIYNSRNNLWLWETRNTRCYHYKFEHK